MTPLSNAVFYALALSLVTGTSSDFASQLSAVESNLSQVKSKVDSWTAAQGYIGGLQVQSQVEALTTGVQGLKTAAESVTAADIEPSQLQPLATAIEATLQSLKAKADDFSRLGLKQIAANDIANLEGPTVDIVTSLVSALGSDCAKLKQLAPLVPQISNAFSGAADAFGASSKPFPSVPSCNVRAVSEPSPGVPFRPFESAPFPAVPIGTANPRPIGFPPPIAVSPLVRPSGLSVRPSGPPVRPSGLNPSWFQIPGQEVRTVAGVPGESPAEGHSVATEVITQYLKTVTVHGRPTSTEPGVIVSTVFVHSSRPSTARNSTSGIALPSTAVPVLLNQTIPGSDDQPQVALIEDPAAANTLMNSTQQLLPLFSNNAGSATIGGAVAAVALAALLL